jgi:Uncharacterized protein conserved in bacteria (DUF2188)
MKRIYWEMSVVPRPEPHGGTKSGRVKKGARKWRVKKGSRTQLVRDTKAEALGEAINMCREDFTLRGRTSELFIKKMDGSIQDKRTYPRSSDPRGTKG